MKRSHRVIINALKSGCTIWKGEMSRTAWLCCPGNRYRRIRGSTLDDMELADLIRSVPVREPSTDTDYVLKGEQDADSQG